jgi:geranylgeranyl pyrophosphate synthase
MSRYLVENDYSTDALRWTKKLEDKNLKPNPLSKDQTGYNPEELEKLQNEIIKAGDSALAYFFATEFMYKQYRMQKLILDKKDAKYAFMFAQHVKNCDVKALQKLVMDSNKIKYITRFACHVKQADRAPLEDLVIQSDKVKYAHEYLKHVKTADVNKFKTLIISSGKPRYLFELAKHLKNQEDIDLVQDLIIASGSYTYMRLFAEKIKSANVEKIEQAVLDREDSEEIKKFAKYVRRSRMKRFLLVM